MTDGILDEQINLEESRLQAVRRLDWRFLFAEVELGQVVYQGQQDEVLWRALSQFSDELNLATDNSVFKNADFLVMKNPSFSEFRTYLKELKPNARFYVEFERDHRQITVNRLPYLYIFTAKRLGYHRITSNWHWTNFAEANRIIPLDSSEGFAHVYAKGRTDKKTQAKVFLLSQLINIGLLHSLVSCLSLIGVRKSL